MKRGFEKQITDLLGQLNDEGLKKALRYVSMLAETAGYVADDAPQKARLVQEQRAQEEAFRQSLDESGLSPEDFDRWGTPKGITKTISVTEENLKAAAEINAMRTGRKKKTTT